VDAHVAQLVEHVLGKDEVTRSIRVVGSILSLLDPEHSDHCSGGEGTAELKRRAAEGGDGEGEI
jgi:hypothetical protein